jgi:hypothetical protein
MKLYTDIGITLLCLALPLGAAAQTQPTGGATQTTASYASDRTSHWLASGFVGSNFGNNAASASANFGGSVGYLWRDRFGAEVDMGFTPNFDLQNNFFGLGVTPQVNTYMANAIFSTSYGPDHQWQPFVSGGVGALSLRSGLDSTITRDPNDSRFAGNIGGGLMGFVGKWGFKADVRYFRAAGSYNAGAATTPNPEPSPTNPSPSPAPGPYGLTTGSMAGVNSSAPAAVNVGNDRAVPTFAEAALQGLHFWRANVGLAYRW